MADTNNTPETPFGLTFETLLEQMNQTGQISAAKPSTAQAAPQPAPANAGTSQPSAPPMSFEELERQIQGNTAQAAMPEPAAQAAAPEPAAQAVAPAQSLDDAVKTAQENAQKKPGVSFDDLVKMSAVNAGITQAAPAQAAPAQQPSRALSFDEMAEQAIGRVNAQVSGAAMNPPASEEPAKAEPAKAEPAKAKKTAKTAKKAEEKTAKKAEEKTELPEDITENYRVDLSAGKQPAKGGAFEALFTKDEVESLRADIRAFVRRELKLAMVGAMKDVLHDFE